MRTRRQRSCILSAVEVFRTVGADLNLSEILCFLYVCENEGIGIKALASLCGLTVATTSRSVRDLCDGRANRVGAGLMIMEVTAIDLRGRTVYLSPKGLELRDRLNGFIAEARPIESLQAPSLLTVRPSRSAAAENPDAAALSKTAPDPTLSRAPAA